jgi:mannan endo-1,4-beta-mannosidase
MLARLPRVVFALSSVLCGLCSALVAGPRDPADPALNARGRAVLAYFQQLQASPDLKLVSGQFAGWSGSSAQMEVLAKIERATGQWPAMIGLDYCGWDDGAAAIHTGPANELALAYWRAGGLVTISWHAPNPANPKGGGLNDKGVDLADLLKPGPTHDRWMQSLDRIAAGLEELQAAGVVVIWRPFHEMNGGWFWWGAKDPAALIAAWRHMFDYFTHTKNLHNLVWSYGPNHGQNGTAAYYAGDAYVDLVGLDAYTDHLDPEHIKDWAGVAALPKPAGFTEFGPHGASNPPGDYDYRRFLDGIAKNFPTARHFLCWDAKWNPAENKFAKEFYNDPRVIARAALPAGLTGK